LLVILLFAWKIKGEWCKSRGEKLDYPGSVIYGLSLIALIYGLSILPEVRGTIIITGGIIGILVFFKWESLSSSPILNINVLRKNKTFVFSILAILTSFSSVFVASFLLSLYFQYVKGFDPAEAGLIMLAVPVMQALLSPFTGRLSDKIEPRIVASIGLVLTLIGICFFIFLDGTTPLIQIIVMLLIMGVGNSLFASPNANAIMSSVEPRYLGTASATMNTSMSLGQALSMGIAMMVMAIIIGRVAITPQYYSAFLASTRVAFSVVAVLVSGGIIFSVFRGKIR
jgi:MFS family permease